jgi:transcriptional regulator with XRE-family HTH domain
VTDPDPRRARLAASLRQLRRAASLSQTDMARRTGWVQPKVSRLETGAQLPTEDDIRTWAAHTYAPAEQIEALLDMLSAAHVEYTPTADLLKPVRWAAGKRTSERWKLPLVGSASISRG